MFFLQLYFSFKGVFNVFLLGDNREMYIMYVYVGKRNLVEKRKKKVENEDLKRDKKTQDNENNHPDIYETPMWFKCCWFWFHWTVLINASEWQIPETLDAAFVSNSTFMTFVIGFYDVPYATEMAQV